MAQPSVASYFNSRKKSAVDEVQRNEQNIKKKVSCAIQAVTFSKDLDKSLIRNANSRAGLNKKDRISNVFEHKLNYKNIARVKNEKKKGFVKFIKKGLLSPKYLCFSKDNGKLFNTLEKNSYLDKCTSESQKNIVRKELNFDEVKTKLTRSSKLEELKASIGRIRDLEKTSKIRQGQNKLSKIQQNESKGTFLKKFDTIDLEILTSPSKNLRTTVKLCPPPPPEKFNIMSPKSTTPKRILFSPSKYNSPVKIETYNKYSNLAKNESLTIPYKYRNLCEIFKAIDSVCAIYFNRKECITFKKLKSAVQKVIRTNFYQSHLAQIKHLYADAYYFCQSKMRNYGSVSKHDYFQLIIIPNIDFFDDRNTFINKDKTSFGLDLDCFNPQLLTLRYQKFQQILIGKVKEEHDKFLKCLDPPLFIPQDEIKRWHPEFDVEKCADIERANLPQPPDIEKFASAKEMLSTARNLFTNSKIVSTKCEDNGTIIKTFPVNVNTCRNVLDNSSLHADRTEDGNSILLKTVPLSLLEKIKAKQAKKAQGVIKRRLSEDLEAIKYSHLIEIARHLRNVFVTEKRSVLTLEVVIEKLSNSYNGCLTQKEIEAQLYSIARECPKWVQIHEIRKATYLKMQKEINMTDILKHLEKSINEKLITRY